MHLDTGDTMLNFLTMPGLRRIFTAALVVISIPGFAQDDLIWNSLVKLNRPVAFCTC